jgi:hypothetical protein
MGVNGTASRRQARMKGLFRSCSLDFGDVKGLLTSRISELSRDATRSKQCLSAVISLNRCRRFWSQIKIQTTIKTQKTVSGLFGDKVVTTRPFVVFVS